MLGFTSSQENLPIFFGVALIIATAIFNLWSLKKKCPELVPSIRLYRRVFLPPVALAAAAIVADLDFWRSTVLRDNVELLSLGANYLPRTIFEPSRLLTSLPLHADGTAFFISLFSLLVLGRAIVAAAGATVLLFVFFLSGITGAIAASTIAPQAVTYGLGPAVAGLAGAWLVLSFDRDTNYRSGSATAATAVLHLGYFLLHPSGTNAVGLLGGGLMGAVAVSAIVLIPVHTFLARTAALTLLLAVLAHWFARLPQPDDRLGFFVRLQASSRAISNTLVELQKSHAAHEIDDAEFARRLDTDALAAIRLNLLAIDSLQSQDHDPTLAARHRELDFQRLAIEVLRDVHAARDIILAAETLEENSHDAADIQLDTFWDISYPQLKRDHDHVEAFNAGPNSLHSNHAVDSLRRGLDDDLAALTESAVELEIRQTEAWLMLVRSQVLPPQGRTVANHVGDAMSDLAARVDSRLSRINSVVEKLPFHSERLDGLQNHLSHIRSSIR